MRESPALKKKFILPLVIIVIVVILVAIAAVFFFTSRGQASAAQPINFPHNVMVSLGVQCLYCHADATSSPSAGMPSVQKCMGCHQTIGTNVAAIIQLTNYWKNNQPVPWVRVYSLPRFVYFSHEVHVNSGVACETCHGDVANMKNAITKPAETLDMGWCLSCHEKQANASQLMECDVCHQ
jgi:c(7)-type cytochrome triheme protein